MTVATLTHPILRRSSIIYTYLILLALTDLLTHLSIIPMILWLLDWRLCSYPSALYYAHIGFPLVNALMGVSVWIVVFLTMSQYMAVCHPFRYSYLRSRKTCFWLSGLAYIINFCIYIPWATKKAVFEVSFEVAQCKFVVCEHQIELWFKVYEWTRETISRLLPFVLLAYFNSKILITYRNTKQDRLRCLASNTQKGSIGVKSEKEERRLFILLFSIVIIFFICTIPAAPLTIFVSDSRSRNLSFQIIRAIINVMEFTKFALNFYFYCLINPDIRRVCIVLARCEKISRQPRIKGQPVNLISQYTRSTRLCDTSPLTFRSNTLQPSSKKTVVFSKSVFGSNPVISGIIGKNDDNWDKVQVFKDSDLIADINENTSML